MVVLRCQPCSAWQLGVAKYRLLNATKDILARLAQAPQRQENEVIAIMHICFV
jgi:hypothetical protein